jgi:hypothetical protein
METRGHGTPFRDSLIAEGKKRGMIIDEAALDRAFRPDSHVAALGGVFDRLSRLA